jgi:hypothetical protein
MRRAGKGSGIKIEIKIKMGIDFSHKAMLVGIHQPHYLPWLRYFEKIARSDVFIVLDDVQYEKNGFQNRNKIKTAQGWTYLTVPIAKPTQRPINEVEIDNRTNWREKHARSIEMSYRKAPFYERYWPEYSAIYEQEWTHLALLNRAMLELYLKHLEIGTRLLFSSELETKGQATDRLAELCHLAGGDTYLSGAYAVEAYLDPAILKAAGIRLAFQAWKAPEYSQLYRQAGFIPDLAILDLLFNEGPRSRELLIESGGITYPDL